MKMGKRSSFERNERDYYPTPYEGVIPLKPFVRGLNYIEPCVGQGHLVKHLLDISNCVYGFDIEVNALKYKLDRQADCFITNPPWDRIILHSIIENLSSQLDTWLLFDADWMHTRQSSELIRKCSKIVSVGRLKWIEGTNHTGKDNCCWYLFIPGHVHGPKFYGR